MDNSSKHPFAHAAAAWLASNSQDKSLLLQGRALQDARAWALENSESLSYQELQFLYASLENAVEEDKKVDRTMPSAQDNNEKTRKRGLVLRSLVGNIKRKALPIIGIAGVVAGGTFFLANAIIPPEYQGNFQLLVEPITNAPKVVEPSARDRSFELPPGEKASNLDYATQIEILKSPTMLDAILKKVQSRYPSLTSSALENGLTVERLVSKETLEPTKILKVRYAAKDPEQVRFVLDNVAQGYLTYNRAEQRTRTLQRRSFIDGQLPVLQKRVEELQSQLQKLPQENRAITARSRLQEQLDIANQPLKQLLTERETLQLQSAQKQEQWEVISPPELLRDSRGNPIPVPSKAKTIIQIGGGMLGLLLGVGVVVLIESKDSGRRYSYQAVEASPPSI
jgi:uncharacterized protein involved in exopolysaccharide biosynthesis